MNRRKIFSVHSIRGILVATASLVATAAAALEPNSCGQHFDETLASLPAAATGGVAIEPIGCSSNAESSRHCLAAASAGNTTVELRRSSASTEPRPYQMWVHVGTTAASGTMKLSLNGAPESSWRVPPTPAFNWQLVTLPDQRPQGFLLQAGYNKLRISLPRAADAAPVTVDCLLLAADPDFVPDVRALHRLDHVWSGVGVLFDARPAGKSWQLVQVSDWHDRWELGGYGTIIAQIRQWPAYASDGALVQEVRHWKAGRFQYVLDPASLRPIAIRPPHQLLPTALLQPAGSFAGFAPLAVAAHQLGHKSEPPKFILRWEAQSSNRDEQPACTAERPLACKPPPSQLVVFERP